MNSGTKALAIICSLELLLIAVVLDYRETGNAESSINLSKAPQKPTKFNEDVAGPLPYLLEPNLETYTDGYAYRVPSYRIETNKKGLRTEEFSRSKPENTTRVLLIGDSYTFGWGVNRSERYSNRMERKLDRSYNDTRIQVINAGIPGWGVEDFRNFYVTRGSDYNPDVVIVGIKADDAVSVETREDFQEEARRDLNGSGPGSRRFQKRVRELNRRYMDSLFKGNTVFSENLNDIRSRTEEENSELILFAEKPSEHPSRILYAKWAEENGVLLVDTPEKLHEMSREERTLPGEDNHPSSKSHAIMAEKLTEEVLPVLTS